MDAPCIQNQALKPFSAADQQDIVARLVRNWDDMAHPMLRKRNPSISL